MKKYLDRISAFFGKYRELTLYIIVGGFTTVISWGSYGLFYYLLDVENVPSNIISWLLAVSFAFTVNKIWVFEDRQNDGVSVLKQILTFAGARLITGLLETVFMYVFVDVLSFHAMGMKIIVSTVVTALNYFISKFFVFKRETK